MPEEITLQYIQQRLSNTFELYGERIIVPGTDYIPASGKVLSSNDLLYGMEALLDGWLTSGRFTEQFEKDLASYVGARYAFMVNSGSSANLLALFTLTSSQLGERAIQKGDEVITVACGFPTTVNPIFQAGAVPVFLDMDLATANMDVTLLENALSEKTKAVIIAHTLGNPFDLSTITAFCKKHNLWLIEDNCDALGATYKGKKTGSFGDLATVSFYPAHHITTGEGGAVLVNNPKLKKIVESFRDWGRDCWCQSGCDNTCGKRFEWQMGELPDGYDHKYIYSHIGFNLKATDIQAAIGVSQLKRIEEFVSKRRENYRYLQAKLAHLSPRILVQQEQENANASWFGLLVYVNDDTISRSELTQFLESKNIGTRLLFGGNLTKQPAYKSQIYRTVGSLKNTDFVMKNAFWLGVWPGLNQEHLDYIASQIEVFLTSH